MPKNKNKERIQTYLSPYVVEKMDALIARKRFTSRSDFVAHAVSHFIGYLEKE
ncbi:MAG: ribbon-helix-helix domain-containing protein [Halobacteria archaeon]